jgi:WD40 repeat protein
MRHASTGEEIVHRQTLSPQLTCVAFSPDGNQVACGANDNVVRILDADTGALCAFLQGHTDTIRAIHFSHNGALLATAGWDSTVRIWNVADERQRVCIQVHRTLVNCVAFSHDGKRLATGSSDKIVRLYDTNSWEELISLRGHLDSVEATAFSPTDTHLVSVSTDHTARLWDVESGRELACFDHADYVYLHAVAFSPDDRYVVTGGNDRIIYVWDRWQGTRAAELAEHGGDVTSVAFFPNSNLLVSGSYDGSAIVWDLAEASTRLRRRGEDPMLVEVPCASYLRDGQFLATSGDQAVRIWDTRKGLQITELRNDSSSAWVANCIAVHSGLSLLLAAGASDGDVRVWDVSYVPPRSDQPVWRSRVDGGSFKCIAFAPDGTLLAAGGIDHMVRVWDAATGRELHICRGHQKPVLGLAFSADGRMLASCSEDRTVRLWDSTTGSLFAWLAVDSSWSRDFSRLRKKAPRDAGNHFERDYVAGTWFLSVAISPDDHWLAAGTDDDSWFGHRVYLWDLTKLFSGEAVRPVELLGHQRSVDSLLFSQDSRLLASGSADNTVRLWELESKVCRHVLGARLATTEVFDAAVSARWQKVLESGDTCLRQGDGSARRVWLPGTPRLIRNPSDQRFWAGSEVPGTNVVFYEICEGS